ncbi:MAG: S-adenosylmethionine:tRNA ribosyltransferase-isomerase, partial [Bacteroidales bacterium]|nr:S-adenosylmethionine:tRNA ribosyltransferase-isomerase [Bacteroidales bacterium]
EYNTIFASTECCSWKCVVGNLKKWKNDVLSLINTADDPDIAKLALKASMDRKEGNTAVVEFRWSTGVPFSRVLDMAGNVPIPPYLNRETEAIDLERYQTLYARVRGSVAAPTAGLHFTPRVLDAIGQKGIDINDVCLHVGAGTFLPVKSSNVADHPMHREPFSVGIGLLRKLAEKKAPLIAVGTTSVRTLESLYYAGVDCIENGAPKDIGQWAPYEREYPYSTEESLKALVEYLESNNLEELKLGTRIIIVPGFRFRLVDYLVTNFHQPESTLILLVSAFVKGDWRRIYDFALANGFRFLSYGDSSLLERVE